MHVVATAGHVDHGKSALLRALTGMEPDRWEEERRRGLTIDLGFVWADLAPDVTVAFVDVPGHERFAANMLAGVAAVRHAVLVVAADDGWARQTEEHLAALDLLAVEPIVAVVTKLGVAGDARASEVAADVSRRLDADGPRATPVHMVDSIDGTGLEELRRSLVEQLRTAAPPIDTGRPRLWVDRTFSVAGTGTVVTGTLAGGGIATGDDVLVVPGRHTARVRGIETLGTAVERVTPEARVALALAGIAREDIARGDAIVASAGASGRALRAAWRSTREFDAWIRPARGEELTARGSWHVHAGTCDVAARLINVPDTLDPDGGPVRIAVDRPLPLVTGDRVVLRDAGKRRVVAGGEVLDPEPAARPRGRTARVARDASLATVAAASRDDRPAALVAASGGARSTIGVRAATGIDRPTGVVAVGEHLVVPGELDRWMAAVTATARDDGGTGVVSRAVLVDSAVAAGALRAVAPALLDHMVQVGTLHTVAGGLALPERADAAGSASATRRAAFLRLLAHDPFAPPDLAVASRQVGLGHEEVTRLVQDGELVVCGTIGFARSAVVHAVDQLVALEASVGRFTTSQARATLGTTRKFALPLLEHLDRTGVTRFDGQTRTVTRRWSVRPGASQ